MIRTVAEFLRALRARELEAIAAATPIRHPGMIGDMYEGLTKGLLARAIFDGLDLRVVDGKVRGTDGELSAQIDCMVVVGEGEQLPNTTHWIYEVGQTIAVIEVKKTLYAHTLGEAYSNLLTVTERSSPREMKRSRILNPFRAVTARDVEDEAEFAHLPVPLQYVFHSIVGDVLLPVRVAIGYEGYASEHSLREGFVRYIEEKRAESGPAVRGLSPFALPSLIIAGDNALVKLNGMPYALRNEGSTEWLAYGSVAGGALLVLLEVLWARLVAMFGISSDVFGDDLTLERVSPLISAAFVESNGQRGWLYTHIRTTRAELETTPFSIGWEPVVLDEVQNVAITVLCLRECIDLDHDESLASYLSSVSLSRDAYVERVLETGLVYMNSKRQLKLLTDKCQCAIDPELGFLAAENHDGRFTRWMERRIANRQASRGAS